MFLAPAVAAGAVTEVGSCRQLPYKPFVDPELAARQEYGNVVADGLMSLLHRGDLGEAERPAYWPDFLARRRDFIGGITSRPRSTMKRRTSVYYAAQCPKGPTSTPFSSSDPDQSSSDRPSNSTIQVPRRAKR